MSDTDSDELLNRVEQLEAQVDLLRERNVRVEADKAWETSRVRVFFLAIITYLVTCLVFSLISVPNPLLNALIPTVAYFLSTQSLPILKRWWLSRKRGTRY